MRHPHEDGGRAKQMLADERANARRFVGQHDPQHWVPKVVVFVIIVCLLVMIAS